MAEFNTIEVLTRAGEERQRFLELSGSDTSDEGLVEGLMMTIGPHDFEVAERRKGELATLCAALRSMDAFVSGQITAEDFRAGFSTLFRQTEGFKGCEPLRGKLQALLAADDIQPDVVSAAWRSGRDYFEVTTTGERNPQKRPPQKFNPGVKEELETEEARYEAHRIRDPARVEALNKLATELVGENPGWEEVERIPEVARERGWVALLASYDRLGDDEEEASRLVEYLRANGRPHLIHINMESGGYTMSGVELSSDGPWPDTYEVPLTDESLDVFLGGNWWYGLYTTGDGRFLYVESDEFHVLAGPRELVEAARGKSYEDAAAEFVEYVEGHGDVDWMNEWLGKLAGIFGHC